MDLRMPLAIVCGLALGFIVAGLATEIYEEFAFQASSTQEGVEFQDGPLAETFQIWGAGTMLAITASLLWGAYRLDGRRGGLVLATLAVATPVWYTFYQVDHAEGIIGIGVAAVAAWAGLVWLGRRAHIGMACGLGLATLVPLSDAVLWPESFSASDVDGLSQFALAATSLAGYLIVLRTVPETSLPRAGAYGVAAGSILTATLAALRHFDGSRADSGWIVALAVLFLVAVTALAWKPTPPVADV